MRRVEGGERERKREKEEEAFRFTPTENVVMEKIVKYGMYYSPQNELIMLGNILLCKKWLSCDSPAVPLVLRFCDFVVKCYPIAEEHLSNYVH